MTVSPQNVGIAVIAAGAELTTGGSNIAVGAYALDAATTCNR